MTSRRPEFEFEQVTDFLFVQLRPFFSTTLALEGPISKGVLHNLIILFRKRHIIFLHNSCIMYIYIHIVHIHMYK